MKTKGIYLSVGRIVHPDWYVGKVVYLDSYVGKVVYLESTGKWTCIISLCGLTCSIHDRYPDRYVVSPVALLMLRGLTWNVQIVANARMYCISYSYWENFRRAARGKKEDLQ